MDKTHGPIEREFRDMMRALAVTLDQMFNGDEQPRRNGFVLLTFRFGELEGGRVNYISNAERPDMLTAMKEFIARTEGRYDESRSVQ